MSATKTTALAIVRTFYLICRASTKTYWYNYTLRLPAVRQRFDQALHQFFTEEYLALLRAISRHNDKVSSRSFHKRLADAEAQFGAKAAETLRHYGYRWGIL